MKTFSANAQSVNRQWWIIDAKDQILGQVAVAAANLIRGKNRPTFTPNVDTGDFVVVINADAKAAHQSVIDVMQAAQQAGLAHISFATQAPQN